MHLKWYRLAAQPRSQVPSQSSGTRFRNECTESSSHHAEYLSCGSQNLTHTLLQHLCPELPPFQDQHQDPTQYQQVQDLNHCRRSKKHQGILGGSKRVACASHLSSLTRSGRKSRARRRALSVISNKKLAEDRLDKYTLSLSWGRTQQSPSKLPTLITPAVQPPSAR
jgi:hypothetical protein